MPQNRNFLYWDRLVLKEPVQQLEGSVMAVLEDETIINVRIPNELIERRETVRERFRRIRTRYNIGFFLTLEAVKGHKIADFLLKQHTKNMYNLRRAKQLFRFVLKLMNLLIGEKREEAMKLCAEFIPKWRPSDRKSK